MLLVSVLALGAAGCVSTGTLGLVAQSAADPAKLLREPHSYKELGYAEGQACRFFVLALVPFGDSTFSKAVSDALKPSGGDALLNVSTSSSLYGFVPIYNVLSFTCTTVKGTAIKIEASTP
jgi:hypothetical protein